MELNTDILPPDSVLTPRMPYLILELLVGHLDFFTLQTLRVVCKTTKRIVETPELLRHFVVRITGGARLDEVLGAPDPVPWNSFLFTQQNHCISRADIQRFLAAYGDRVVHLGGWFPASSFDVLGGWNLKQTLEDRLSLPLVSGCRHLERLQSSQLRLGTAQHEMTRRLLGNWKHMRHFHVGLFLADSDRPHGEMRVFAQMLSTFAQLVTLTVPKFSYQVAPFLPVEYVESFQRFVFTPLLDTIAKGHLRSVTLPQLGLNNELLLRLAIACQEKGTVLLTPRFEDSHLRTLLENLPPEHLSLLDIIGHLTVITDTIIRQRLTNVRRIYFKRSAFKVQNNEYAMPAFPHLTDLEFDFCCEARKSLELFVERPAEVQRPSVKSLCVSYERYEPIVHISPVDLCTSFVNLRVLRVERWEGEDAEWLRLWPLVGPTLVELELEHCPNLSDRVILGDDLNQPAFLQLKHLRKLTIWKWSNLITDLSFLHAVRHMRLRTFFFFDTEGSWHCVIPKKAMWDGVFGESVEEFEVQGQDLMRERPRDRQKPVSNADSRESDLEKEVHSKNCSTCCSTT